jgi:hypothetical protein
MSNPLDTKRLKALCEAVIRDIGDENGIPMAQDWNWARLVNESLPELREFLKDDCVQEKAALWDALMSSQRIRVLGSVGLKPGDTYHHIGVEFFSKHTAETTPQDLAWFMKYVNALKGKR